MDFNKYQDMCKEVVSEFYDTIGMVVKPEEVYVVWYCKTLQNAKALLSTDIPDGRYFEVTYNGDKKELYVDTYVKEHNVRIKL